MRLIRSWPATIPPGRSYVVDGIERLIMDGFDYRTLADVDDDLILIEWDLAVGKGELETFVSRCRTDPERVRVAPYLLYQSFSGRSYHFHPLWAHRRYTDGETKMRNVTPDDKTCHLFGFGMTYLPRALVAAYLADWSHTHFDDVAFSGWHYRNVEREVPIEWDCQPVHLHYQLPEVR